MLKSPEVGEFVLNIHMGKIGRIIDISKQWSWLKVKYLAGDVRTYSYYDNKCLSLVRLSKEQKADVILQLENRGITNHWLD